MAIWVPSVRNISDGQPVSAATDNGPLTDLTNRTQYLKDRIDALTESSSIVYPSQPVDTDVVVGTPVYFNNVISKFDQAFTDIDTTDINKASETTFWQGIATNVNSGIADIVLGGVLTLDTADWAAVFEDGVFASGDIYLSGTPGKLTTDPGTSDVYIGHMSTSGTLIVRLGNPGALLDHVHYERVLVGDPAGTVVDPGVGVDQTIATPDANEQGWLPANATYFPGFVVGTQIPTGAKFGYNIQHPNETELREVFPLVPPGNSQFVQSGQVLDSSLVVTNEYGIWWMDDTYGNAPWPVDYVASGEVAADIQLWTTRIIASSTILDLIRDTIVAGFETGGADSFAVTGILSADSTDLGVSGTEGDAINGYRGQVVLTNLGVTDIRFGRGLTGSAPLGNSTTGYKGLVDVEFTNDLAAEHHWTELDGANSSPTEKMSLLTTNGVSVGATIGLRGHRLGAVATDYIDFLIMAGSDLAPATDYQVTLNIQGCVDTVSATPANGDIDVSFYRLTPGSPVGTSRLQRTTQATFQTGLPGRLQSVTVGPFADVVVRNNDQLLVRVTNATGSPLPTDTFRALAVYYRLIEV